jgi:hypothetical protein
VSKSSDSGRLQNTKSLGERQGDCEGERIKAPSLRPRAMRFQLQRLLRIPDAGLVRGWCGSVDGNKARVELAGFSGLRDTRDCCSVFVSMWSQEGGGYQAGPSRTSEDRSGDHRRRCPSRAP